MSTIELRQVEKKFGDLHAVKSLDLTIQDGEFIAVSYTHLTLPTTPYV